MPRSQSIRLALFTLAVALCATTVYAVRGAIWPADGSLVGMNEIAVRSRYSEAMDEFAGHYGNPDLRWSQQFKGEIKSAVFSRLLGDVYVTYEKRNAQWVVIANSYLPRGAAF